MRKEKSRGLWAEGEQRECQREKWEKRRMTRREKKKESREGVEQLSQGLQILFVPWTLACLSSGLTGSGLMNNTIK